MDSPHSLAANFVSVNITSKMLNVTNSQGVMRNPDGKFYRGDAFEISYHIYVTGAALPSSILTNASIAYPADTLDLVSSSNSSGIVQFSILQTSPYAAYNVTIVPYLFNEVGNAKIDAPSSIISQQPFAVVEYHPFFAYFTYMEVQQLELVNICEALRHSGQVRRQRSRIFVCGRRKYRSVQRVQFHYGEGVHKQLHFLD